MVKKHQPFCFWARIREEIKKLSIKRFIKTINIKPHIERNER